MGVLGVLLPMPVAQVVRVARVTQLARLRGDSVGLDGVGVVANGTELTQHVHAARLVCLRSERMGGADVCNGQAPSKGRSARGLA